MNILIVNIHTHLKGEQRDIRGPEIFPYKKEEDTNSGLPKLEMKSLSNHFYIY
jgi:hypothetical protein